MKGMKHTIYNHLQTTFQKNIVADTNNCDLHLKYMQNLIICLFSI